MSDTEQIIRLCDLTSFRGNDLVILKNLYLKYINNKALICMSCPGNLKHHIKSFQQNKENMLKKAL